MKLSLISIFLLSTFSHAFGQLLVTLPNGQIQGHELKTFTNKSYYGFQSIPYGAPPVGELRFQAPQPVQDWTDVKSAINDSSMCFQLQYDGPEESEDCLYINVFTPVLNANRNTSKLPVVFFIYGGGLRNGAARFQDYRPEYWIDEEVIFITHNYRVGIFGFLSTGDSIIPGNNGLKDQVLALKWTHENIHLFGGDNEKITIMGQSAGAVSVGYQLLIKQSAGLFRSAIAESGSPMNIYSFIEHPKNYAIDLAQAINSNISSNASSEEIRDFLLSLTGRTIDSYSRATKISQPAIAIEPESASAVVTKEMLEMFNVGDFSKVPILMGINSEEALFIAKSTKYLTDLGRSYDADSSLVVPDIFPHSLDIDPKIIGNAIGDIYVGNDTWANHIGRVVRHFSDNRFSRAIIKQGQLIAKYAPVYFYEFSYDGVLGDWTTVVEDAEKIQHAEELKYLFLNDTLSTINEDDALTHQRLIKLWTDFIKYQNPTPTQSKLLQNITWPTVSSDDYKYLNINNSLSIETNPKQEYFAGWEQVFEKYGKRPFATY